MPPQPPQWTEFLSCSNCMKEFTLDWGRYPVTLVCGHSVCRECTDKVQKQGCLFDPTTLTPDVNNLGVNFALLRLVACQNERNVSRPEDPRQLVLKLGENYHHYLAATKYVEELILYLRDIKKGILPHESELTKPMQRKLVNLVQCQLALEDGRLRTLRACRALGERSATELILAHQNPTTLSGNLWTEVRGRGCQFLGPAMQEEALKLILLALEDGSELSRKVLVMFVVQKLQQQFPQASKTSIGHVVQLLYRASCFVVKKRDGDSSLMRLKEIYRTYPSLRREHDAQVVQIAREAGLRIAPDQWSALLYGDQDHKSHMQSVIDRLQSGESFQRCIHDLSNAIEKSGDPGNLTILLPCFEVLCEVNGENSEEEDQKNDWNLLLKCLEAVKKITQELAIFSKNHSHELWQDEDALAQTAKYKTSFCRDIRSKGRCPRGATCTFAHTEEELHHYRNKRKKPSLGHAAPRRDDMPRVRSPLLTSTGVEGKTSQPDRGVNLMGDQCKQPSCQSMQVPHMDTSPHHQYFCQQPTPHRYPHQQPNNPTMPLPPYSPQHYHQMPASLPPPRQTMVHTPNMPYSHYPPANQAVYSQQQQFVPNPRMVGPRPNYAPPVTDAVGNYQVLAPSKQTRFHVPLYPGNHDTQSKGPQERHGNIGKDVTLKPQVSVDVPHFTVTVSFQDGRQEKMLKNHPNQTQIKAASNVREWQPAPQATFSVAHSTSGDRSCANTYSAQLPSSVHENMVRSPIYNQYPNMPQNNHFEVQQMAYNYATPMQGQLMGSALPPRVPPGQVLVAPFQSNQPPKQGDQYATDQIFYPIMGQQDTEAAAQYIDTMTPNSVPVVLPMAGPVMPSQDPRVAIVAPQPMVPSPVMTPSLFDPNTNVVYQSPSPMVQPVLIAPSPSPANQPQVLIPLVPGGQGGAQYQVMDSETTPEVMQRKQQSPAAVGPSDGVARDLSIPKSVNEATVEQLERRKDQIINRLIRNQTEKGRDEVPVSCEDYYDVWNSQTCSPFTPNTQNCDTAENLHDEELLTNIVDVMADMDTRTSQVTVRGTDHLNMSHSNNERALDDAKMHRMIIAEHDHRRSMKPPSTAKQPLGALINYSRSPPPQRVLGTFSSHSFCLAPSSGPQAEDDEMIPFSDRPTVSKYGPIARSVRTRPSNTDVVQVNANADVLPQSVTTVKEPGQCEVSSGQSNMHAAANYYSSFEHLHAPSYLPTSFVRDREVIIAPAARNHPTIPPATGAMTNSHMSPVQAASNSKLLQREETALQQNQMQSYPEDLQLAMELQQIELGIHRKRRRQNQ